jgi:hypothetical protein
VINTATVTDEASGLVSIGTKSSIGIGQRALMVPTWAGNVLLNCIPSLDEETIELVRERGGVVAIAARTSNSCVTAQ